MSLKDDGWTDLNKSKHSNKNREWRYNFDIATQQNDNNTILIGHIKSLQLGIKELSTIIHIIRYIIAID